MGLILLTVMRNENELPDPLDDVVLYEIRAEGKTRGHFKRCTMHEAVRTARLKMRAHMRDMQILESGNVVAELKRWSR